MSAASGTSALSFLFYPLFLAAASLPVVHVLGWAGALSFGAGALAWLVFGRLLIFGMFAFQLAKIWTPRRSGIVCCAIVDALALYAAYRIDVRCLWGAIAAVIVVESLWWWQWSEPAG